VFALIGTAVSKRACCQPDAVSFLKVTVASGVPPVPAQRWPRWVPVFVGPL
jgi:hypothetical protein